MEGPATYYADSMSAADLLRLAGVGPEEADRIRPPAPAALIATEEELSAARLSPRCIVRHLVYADVAVLVAPGGAGKTTLSIFEAVHVALGWPVWGLPVEAPGWTLFVTAEDRREQFLARLREILDALDLSPKDRTCALRGVRVWDVTGQAVKLIRAADGNIRLTTLADDIVETYATDPPAVVNFDPLVSFGASEGMVNDNEQGLITAARRIVRGLDCCVKLTHHTGKANAREGTLDQYSGRGGSALADGSRMLTVLGAWDAEAPGHRQPPSGCHPAPEASIAILARAKLSYAPPNLPLIWVRRVGFGYEHFTEGPRLSPEAQRSAHSDQVERFLLSEIKRDRRHTQNSLEDSADILNLNRKAIRAALNELKVSGRVMDAPLPKEDRHGRRTTYLFPLSQCAAADGALEPDLAENLPAVDPNAPPSFNAPPYRERKDGALDAAFLSPLSLQCAEDERRITAHLAHYEGDDIQEVLI